MRHRFVNRRAEPWRIALAVVIAGAIVAVMATEGWLLLKSILSS
jgi:hypothetical protein